MQMELKALIQEATQHLQAGNVAAADALIADALPQRPNNPELWHLLGVLKYQTGKAEEAAQAMSQAIALKGTVPEYHNNFGEALRRCGRNEEAVRAYLNAIRLHAGFLAAWVNLGALLLAMNRLQEAAEAYRGALRVDPYHARARDGLGKSVALAGDSAAAEEQFRNAVELEPTQAEYWFDWALALHNLGRLEQAIWCYRRAIAIQPDYAAAYNNLSNTLRTAHQVEEALEAAQRAVELQPDYPDAWNNLGVALGTMRRMPEAIDAFERAIATQPNHADAHYNLAKALQATDRHQQAIAHFRRAAEIQPRHGEALNGLASSLHALGRLEEAMTQYRTAIAAQPDFARAWSNYLFALQFDPRTDAAQLEREHRRWSDALVAPRIIRRVRHAEDRDRARRLRIGYISADFRAHAAAFFIEPILANHDHERFEVFCYSDSAPPDEVTRRCKKHADTWLDTIDLIDEQLAQRVRDDRIDILIDLSVHSAGNRLLAFAQKPAPVQISYLGYCGTSGLDAIDFRITDDVVDPPGVTESFGTEKLLRLPRTFCCYRPPPDAPEVAPPPMERNDFVTFGAANKLAKTTPQMLEIWAKLLTGVPRSRLIFRASPFAEEQTRDEISAAFAKAGIESSRLDLLPSASMREYLRSFNQIDIALDTFPFNGHTTTCHCLWMGLPVVSLTGRIPVSRVGASLLRHVGLQHLAVASADDYIATARALALDRPRLAEIRRSLRQRMRESPLMDEKAFATDLEAAYLSLQTR